MASRELARSSAGNDRLRQQFAPSATDGDLSYFAKVCRHLQVDPWAGHICLIARADGRTGELVHKPTLTVAGRRFIAQRTGRLRGIVGPQWCAPRAHAGAPLDWLELWDRDEFPYAARCLVLVADWDTPANGTVKWSEFAQRARGGGLTPTWQSMPSHMLGKVAESLALRRGFSEVASAVAYVDGDDDDASMGREVEAEAYVADPSPEVQPPTVTPPEPAGAAAGPPPAMRTPADPAISELPRDASPDQEGDTSATVRLGASRGDSDRPSAEDVAAATDASRSREDALEARVAKLEPAARAAYDREVAARNLPTALPVSGAVLTALERLADDVEANR